LSYSSLRHWPDSNPQPLYEVARAFTTPQILARESAAQVFVRCSITELQQLSSLVGIEPATVGFIEYPEPSPRRKLFNLFSFPPYVVASLLLSRAHP